MKIPALVTRFVFVFFFAFIFLLFAAHAQTFAQTQNYQNNQSYPTNQSAFPNTNPDVPNNLHTYSQNVLIELMSAAVCQLAGVDPVNPHQQCLGIDQKTNKIGFVQNGGGAIGLMGNAIGMLYAPPVHTSDYFAYLGNNFGVTKQSYAAANTGPTTKNVGTGGGTAGIGGSGGQNVTTSNTGFQALSPLINLWSAFRNVVYILFVLLFVIIGIAIMLRVHIDPRTVMTVQNQIPKIIIGLLLVTFSFAIAGFLIDIMYESIYLTTNLFIQVDPNFKADVATNLIQSDNPIQAVDIATHGGTGAGGNALGGIKDIAWQPSKTIGNFIAPLFDNTPGNLIAGAIMAVVGGAIGSTFASGIPFSALIGGVIGGVAGLIIGGSSVIYAFVSVIAFLVISAAILFALFRVWFMLLSAYIFILLDVVFAPFWIAIGLFPGTQINFSVWIRDIISNLSAFPVVIVMFELARVFIDAFTAANPQTAFVPPLVGNINATNEIGALIGLGFVLLTPNAIVFTKAALKAPKFDTAPIAAALGAGVGYVSAVHGHVGGTVMGSQEAYARPGPNGAAFYQAKGPWRAFLGRFYRG